MAGNDPLEEYAQGIGAGAYSPQQGSGLPIAPVRTGGLPLGQAPSAVAAPQVQPAPQAPFQQAPLLQLNGQQAPIEQMIQQRLQAVQNYPNLGFFQKLMGGGAARGQAMNELPILQKQAEIRSQGRDLQMKALTDLAAHAKDFAALPPDQQAAQRPVYEKLLQARSQLAGLNLSPEDIAHAHSSPDLANTYASVLNDDLIPKDQAIARLSSVAAGKPREDALGAIQTEATQRALTMVQQYLPQAAAQYGGQPGKPIDAATFVQKLQTDPQLGQYLQKSPSLTRALNGFLSDKANAETLAGWNIKPGVVNLKQMEEQAKGPSLTGELKDVLATMKGPDGKPLTEASVAALPNGADIIAKAQAQVFNNKLDIAKSQGFNAVIAKSDAERQVPIVQVPGMTDVHIVNKGSEQPVDRLSTTIDDLRKQGGEGKFAVMNGKSYEAFAAAKEADGILGQYLDLSKALTTTPGANFGQALVMYAKTKGGVENPGVQFDALKGTILRMARAMQGSSQSLSNLDANSVGGMLPTPMDTAQTAIQRLEVAAKIVQNMKDVQLGKLAPEALMDKIAEAKQQVAKMQGVDLYKNAKGQTIAIPRGQSHPGKGWEKQ